MFRRKPPTTEESKPLIPVQPAVEYRTAYKKLWIDALANYTP